MFIQVIQGRTTDAEGLRGQLDRWMQEQVADAKGYLGTTAGVAEDGTVIMIARFESEKAARKNSGRAEQGAWWNETAKYFDGEVSFRDCGDVETTLAGGSDDAGFVQVMQGRVTDRARLRELEAQWLPTMQARRPDVIGSVRAWDGNVFTEAIYFTSEADARKGEATMAEGDIPGLDDEFASLVQDLTFIDLEDPWLFGP